MLKRRRKKICGYREDSLPSGQWLDVWPAVLEEVPLPLLLLLCPSAGSGGWTCSLVSCLGAHEARLQGIFRTRSAWKLDFSANMVKLGEGLCLAL